MELKGSRRDGVSSAVQVSCHSLIGLFLAISPAFPVAFPFEEARPLYVGARALGMGNAFTAVADDATAGFWNPAGLIQWQGVKLFGVNKFYDRSDYGFDPKGIGYAYRGYGFAWGNKIALGVESGTPDFNYYSFARKIHSHIAIGGSLKFKRKHPSDYYQFFGHSPSYDLALLVKPRSELKFGLLAGNLPSERGINWLTLGAAYQWENLLFAIDLMVPRGALNETGLYYGIEWKAHRFIRVRGGRSDQSWTLGLGFDRRWIRIDYARIHEPDFASDFISGELRF